MSSKTSISPGIWKLVFVPISIVTGNIDIYLQTPGGISKDTRFLKSDKKLTVSVPGNANKIINSSAHVTGVVALFMQWGIVQKNDLFLYSQKLKSALIKYVNKNPKESCPNNLMRYELLDLCGY